jgi:hypothetical protein
MSNIEKAMELFRGAGLAFPTIPEEFTAALKERGPWVFSTRPLATSPYNLQDYVDEGEGSQIENYAVLAHSGHGVNSYAIQYYLVQNLLRMFLHLGWGGVYMDSTEATATVRDCFAMADKLVLAIQHSKKITDRERLLVVGSDFYGSYWRGPGKSGVSEEPNSTRPLPVLTEAYRWLMNDRCGARIGRAGLRRSREMTHVC